MVSTSILVVDDDADFRAAVCRLLSGAGYGVAQAKDGTGALAALRCDPADILVTDIIMPDGDGIELIEAAKGRFPAMRVLAVSGRGSLGPLDLLKMAAMIGADATLHKPLDPDQLLAKIAELAAAGPGGGAD